MSRELTDLEAKVLEAVPYLIELWHAYTDSTSEEPTDRQLQAGFVELIDMESAFRMNLALGAIEAYEMELNDYARVKALDLADLKSLEQ